MLQIRSELGQMRHSNDTMGVHFSPTVCRPVICTLGIISWLREIGSTNPIHALSDHLRGAMFESDDGLARVRWSRTCPTVLKGCRGTVPESLT